MANSGPASTGRIFVSYRREETAYPAGWLFDRLSEHFGGGQIFKDVDSIELGDDFIEEITAQPSLRRPLRAQEPSIRSRTRARDASS
jgi:hypothetical protein